jgi:uncharacterized protein
MLATIRQRTGYQRLVGLGVGVAFGFLLQKGGVANYDVIIGQLLLTDFTVVKIMGTAVIVGMLGVHLLRSLGAVQLHPKPGSVGMSLVGGLIFGVGFGLLGYCPGTSVAAVAQGSLDALVGGVGGILIGAAVFAALFPRLDRSVLGKGSFGELTLPQLFHVNAWVLVIPMAALFTAALWILERAGL